MAATVGKVKVHFAKTPKNLGRAAWKHYCDMRGYERADRREHYTVTNLVTDVLTFAQSKGWDVETILSSARTHLWCETVEHCATCGHAVTRENGETSGDKWYCSEECIPIQEEA